MSRFLEISGLLPGATPLRPPNDPPDFFVKQDGVRTSIEVTRIFLGGRDGSPVRGGEANRQWICEWLEGQLPLAGLKPLWVSIGFAHDALTKGERGPLAAKILDLVRVHDPSDEQPIDLGWRQYASHGQWDPTWPESLDHLTLFRPPGWNAFEVMNAESGWMLTSPQELLKEAIEDKGRKLPKYQGEYDKNWLLMVAEVHGPSSFIEADEASRQHLYAFPFDRTFFFQDFGKRWFELRRE